MMTCTRVELHAYDTLLRSGVNTLYECHAGANKGLGYELCKILLKHKHPVIAACRTQQKGANKHACMRS